MLHIALFNEFVEERSIEVSLFAHNKIIFGIAERNSEKFSNVHIIWSFVGEVSEKISGKLVTGCGTGHILPSEKESDSVTVKRLTDILKEQPEL